MHIEDIGSIPHIKLVDPEDKDDVDAEIVSPSLEEFLEPTCVGQPRMFSKQCQQIFCILFYCTSSISLTLYNKWLLSKYNFHFPITMILYHSFSNSLGSWFFVFAFFREKFSKLDDWVTKLDRWRFVKLIVPVSCFFAGDIVFTQIGLMLSSVTLAEIVKATVPVVVFIFGILLKHETYTPFKASVMGILTIGVMLTTLGDQNLNLTGLIFFMLAVVAAAAKLLYIESLCSSKHLGLPALLALAYISSTCVPLLFIGAASIEWKTLFDSEFVENSKEGASTFGWLTVGAVMALCLNLSEILLIGTTSAVTTCVVGIGKMIVVIGLGEVFFGKNLNPTNIAGIVITCVGIGGYNYIKLQNRRTMMKKLNVKSVENYGPVLPELEKFTKAMDQILDMK